MEGLLGKLGFSRFSGYDRLPRSRAGVLPLSGALWSSGPGEGFASRTQGHPPGLVVRLAGHLLSS